jgi:UDP-N-acetylmuramoylalanine--D-glutamate ligase
MDVQGKRVLVVGLARSGLAVAHALARRGAVVTVTDRKPPAEFRDVLPQLFKDKVGVELGSQRVETFLRHQIIVTSPGVPWDMPQLQAARERMIPIYPEVEAASWFLQGTLVGITGSNGKTTTTSLLGDMLKASGFPTFVGGNIGSALSLAVDHAKPGTRFVTELSSFQLEGIREFRPHVAVMLNLSPNHLDRHPNLEAYSQAKRQIFRNQGGQDYAVLNADDPWVAGLQAGVSGQPVLFSRHRELPNGVFVSGGKIYYRVRHLERVLFETRDVTLKGDFNLEDVLAATAAACVLGADFMAIRKAVRAFHAVEHRLEFVRKIEEVDFYNNSKATSVDATVKSLEAFERGVHLIMGGKDKGAPYAPLRPLMKDRVREVLLIGAAAPIIADQLAGSVELVQAGDIATAVTQAFTRSRPGDTVLLAPACSSFDQFEDYEERGRVFKDLVKQLAKDVSEGRVVRIPNSEFRIPESEVRSLESGIGNLESGVSKTGSPEPEVRSPESEVRSPEPTTPGPKSEVRSPKSEVESTQSEARNLESGIGNLESGIRNSESGISEPIPTKSANLEPVSPSPEPRVVPSPELSRVPSPEPRAPLPESHVPLTYVYEVDAVDMPELESQVLPDDEPVVSVSANPEEILDDEVLPFEARPAAEKESEVQSPKSEVKGKSEVRGPESETPSPESRVPNPEPEVRSSESEVQGQSEVSPAPRQPKLFNGNDK